MNHDEQAVRAWALRESQPAIERRVLAAVITEPAKLAIAAELEIADFQDPRLAATFSALRNLQASNADIDAVAIAEYLTLQSARRGAASSDLRALHQQFCSALFELISNAPTYERAFGAAALAIFAADLKQLRAIATERRKVMQTR